MLEEIIFGNVTMPMEIIRLLVAFAGVGIAAYYDLFNNKNVPDKFLYGFLGIAFLVNFVLYEESLFLFSVATAAFLGAIGYVFYRLGQIGGADVIVAAAVMLLLPIMPSFAVAGFNIPFIFPTVIFGGMIFAVYITVSMAIKLREEEAKPNMIYGLMIIPYLLFLWVYSTSLLFSPVYFLFITVLFITTVFFLMYKKDLNKILAEQMPVEQLEPEDVLALELMGPAKVKKYGMQRLVTEKEIARLKNEKAGEVWVYTKLPPFLPFIMAGMILALFFTRNLLFM